METTETTKTYEFKKEVRLGNIYYFSEVNGEFVSGTLDMNKDKAYEVFLHLVNSNGKLAVSVVETLEKIIK